MAKLLKHLGIGVKKTPPNSGSSSSSTPPTSSGPSGPTHRAEYNSTQKSTSVQELLPKSPTRYRSSGSLSTNVNHDFDTQSLKSFFDGQPRSIHDHRTGPGLGHHGGSGVGRHRGGGDPGSMSPKGGGAVGGSDGHYPAAYGTSVMSVTEEGEVFDSSPGTSSAQSTETSINHMATPPRLTDEYCDPVDLRNQLAESADLLGACAPAPTIEDDYSVPYEVKKIVKDVKLTNWHGTNGIASHISGEQRTGSSPHLTSISSMPGGGSDGTSFDDSFDEPWEWTAKMNNLAQSSLLYGSKNNKCTPLMTPKKTINGHSELSGRKSEEAESIAKLTDFIITDRSTLDKTVEDKENIKEGREGVKNVEGTLNAEVKNNDAKWVPTLDSILSCDGSQDGKNSQGGSGTELVTSDDVASSSSQIQANLLSRISAVDRPNKLGSGGSLIVSTVIGGVDAYECYTSSPSGVMTQKLVVNSLASPESSVVSPTECSPLASPSTTSIAEISPPGSGGSNKFQHNQKCVARDDGATTTDNLQTPSGLGETCSVGGGAVAACKKCDHGKQLGSKKHKSGRGSTKSSGSESTNITPVLSSASVTTTTTTPASTAGTGSALKIDTDLAVEQQCWYHGSVGRTVAEDLLRAHKEGSFLVRQSESNKQDYSLSLKSAQGFLHMKIVNHDGKFILGQFSQPFETIPLMIDFYCTSKLPIKGNEHICLVHPLDSDLL